MSCPPISRIRTKCGTPAVWTTMLVTRAPTSTSASVWPLAEAAACPASAARRSSSGRRMVGRQPGLLDAARRCPARCRGRRRPAGRAASGRRGPCTSSSGWKSSTACSTGMGSRSATCSARLLRSSSAAARAARPCARRPAGWRPRARPSCRRTWSRAHSSLMAAATATGSTTSPSRTAPAGHGDLAELLQGHAVPAERQLGGADARGPDVETDGGSCCHGASPSAAATLPWPWGRSEASDRPGEGRP